MHLGWNSELKYYGVLSDVDLWIIQALHEEGIYIC